MSKLSNLKHLHYLVTLYDHQHFGEAAKACFISQSTLSAAIANLEELLEMQLLERNHKSFLFTPFGEEVVRKSRVILQQTEELMEFAKNQGEPMQGQFYLGIIPTIAPFILNELQAICRKKYPLFKLLVREDTTDHCLNYLREGKLDAVLLALPYAVDEFFSQRLVKDHFKLVMPKAWQNKSFDIYFNNVPDQSVFLLEKEHCLSDHALSACQLKDNHKINPFSATSLHTLIQMVEYQPGITFLPELALNSGVLKGTHLTDQSLANNQDYRELAMVWRYTSFQRQRYNLLAQIIKDILIEKIKPKSPRA